MTLAGDAVLHIVSVLVVVPCTQAQKEQQRQEVSGEAAQRTWLVCVLLQADTAMQAATLVRQHFAPLLRERGRRFRLHLVRVAPDPRGECTQADLVAQGICNKAAALGVAGESVLPASLLLWMSCCLSAALASSSACCSGF